MGTMKNGPRNFNGAKIALKKPAPANTPLSPRQSDDQQDRQRDAEQPAIRMRASHGVLARYLLQVATVAAPFTTDHLFFSILTSV